MRKLTLEIPLHRAQAAYHLSKALFRGFVGGRSAGKSVAGAVDTLLRSEPNRTYLVASPTGVKLNDETYPTFKKYAQDLNLWGTVKLTPYPNVVLTNGATVRFRSAEDPEKLRGPNLSGIWLDEASLMHKDVYTISIACLREEGRQGWLGATFTPKGQYHWTYEVFGKGLPNTALIHAPTRANIFNPPGFADTLESQYSPQFVQQEIEGKFLNIEGSEFPAEWFGQSIWFDDWPRHLTIATMALDPSKGARDRIATAKRHGDFSAFVMFGRDAEGTCWIEGDLDYIRSTTQIVTDGIRLAKQFERETNRTLDGFGIESDQFQYLLAEEFRRQTLTSGFMLPIYEMTTEGVDKRTRIRRLTPFLKAGNFRFRRTLGTELLVRQLQEFPVGDFDDGPDALEQARRLAVEIWNGVAGQRHSGPKRVRV